MHVQYIDLQQNSDELHNLLRTSEPRSAHALLGMYKWLCKLVFSYVVFALRHKCLSVVFAGEGR